MSSATADVFGSVSNVSFVTAKSDAGALQKVLDGLAPVKNAVEGGFNKLRESLQGRKDAAIAKFEDAFGGKEQAVSAGGISPAVKDVASQLLASSGAVVSADSDVVRPIAPAAQTKREIV